MLKIKFNICIISLIFLAQRCCATMTGIKELGQSIEKVLPDAASKAVKFGEIAGKALTISSQHVGYDAMEVLAKSNLEIVKKAAPAMVDASSKIGFDSAKIFEPHMGSCLFIIKVLASVHCATQIYPITKDMYTYLFPTEEQKNSYQADIIASRNRLRYLKTAEQFRECLLQSKPDSARNVFGCPKDCEQAAYVLSMLGAKSEVERMTAVFNAYNKR